jgi:hypothetical protein
MATEIGGTRNQPAATDVAVKNKPGKGSQPGGIIHDINHLASGFDYALSHPFSTVINDLRGMVGILTGNGAAVNASANRVMGWVQSTPIASLKAWVLRQLAKLRAELNADMLAMIKLYFLLNKVLTNYINRLVRSETHYRKLGDLAAEKYARNQVNALHHLIERESASAYRGQSGGRIELITRVTDLIANRNPVVRRLAGLLIGGALDLLSVDNPLARIALGFVMRHFIDRLGVDKVAGSFVSGLLDPLLGNPRPRDLPGVIRDVSSRLGALESQWGQFYANGGAEIEQAGHQWAAITGPVGDIALIAWLGQAALDPVAWARELSGAVEPVLTGAADAMHALLR